MTATVGRVTRAKKEAFLRTLRVTANVSEGCKVAGFCPTTQLELSRYIYISGNALKSDDHANTVIDFLLQLVRPLISSSRFMIRVVLSLRARAG